MVAEPPPTTNNSSPPVSVLLPALIVAAMVFCVTCTLSSPSPALIVCEAAPTMMVSLSLLPLTTRLRVLLAVKVVPTARVTFSKLAMPAPMITRPPPVMFSVSPIGELEPALSVLLLSSVPSTEMTSSPLPVIAEVLAVARVTLMSPVALAADRFSKF